MTNQKANLVLGLAICWGCNIAHLALGWFLVFPLPRVGVVVIGGIGVLQLAYVIPLCLHFKKEGETNVIKGLIIAASITALLNVGCWTFKP
jgi:hypothetical protein